MKRLLLVLLAALFAAVTLTGCWWPGEYHEGGDHRDHGQGYDRHQGDRDHERGYDEHDRY